MPQSDEPDRAVAVDFEPSDRTRIELVQALQERRLRRDRRTSVEPALSVRPGRRALHHRREKLRQRTANGQALARQGRYRKVEAGLDVKQVWVGEGETRAGGSRSVP